MEFVERTAKPVWLARNEQDKKKELGVVGRGQIIRNRETATGFYSNEKVLEGFEEGQGLIWSTFYKDHPGEWRTGRWAVGRGPKSGLQVLLS